MNGDAMPLSEASLARKLKQPFRYHPTVDSTNDLAMTWLKSGAPDGAVIIADEQVRGRGRMGRLWHTPPGVALAVSLILRPAPAGAGRVTMLGALSIAEMCEQAGASGVGIKWPNDVQINGRKVCGILPEALWEHDRLLGVVLGMGVNVRLNMPPDILETAINLEDAVSRRLDRVELIAILLERAQTWYAQLQTSAIVEAWRARLVMLGRTVQVGDVKGVAEDTDEHGALLVRTSDGVLHRLIAGDLNLMDYSE